MLLLTLWAALAAADANAPSDAGVAGWDNAAAVDATLAAQRGDAGVKPQALSIGDAVALALRQNFELRNASLQRLAERFGVHVALDKFKPHWGATAQAGKTFAFGALGPQDARGATVQLIPHAEILIPTGALLSADLEEAFGDPATFAERPYSSTLVLGISQPLRKNFGPAIGRASVRQAIWRDGVSKLTFKAELLRIATAAAFAYRDYAQASLTCDIARKAVDRAREVLENNRQLVAAGRLAPSELVQVESGIASREANLANAETDLISFQMALLGLLALGPDSAIEAVPEAEPAALSLSRSAARDLALQSRPEYAASTLQRQAAAEQLRIAHNNRRWDLNFLTQYRRGSAAAGPARVQADALRRGGQSIFLGLTLSMPVIPVTLDQDIVTAQAELTQADVARQAAANTIDLQVDAAIKTLQLRQLVHRLAARARRLANKNLQNEQEKLAAGRSSTFVVLRFVDDLVNAEIAELQARIAYYNAATALQSQTGTLLETFGIEPNHLENPAFQR